MPESQASIVRVSVPLDLEILRVVQAIAKIERVSTEAAFYVLIGYGVGIWSGSDVPMKVLGFADWREANRKAGEGAPQERGG